MKHLLLLLLFSGSLSAFSQDKAPKYAVSDNILYLHDIGEPCHCASCERKNKPDTLRAIVLVTLHENGPAVARMGFVVISEGRRPVYLDCQKKALKLPQVGWGYEVINPNYKK